MSIYLRATAPHARRLLVVRPVATFSTSAKEDAVTTWEESTAVVEGKAATRLWRDEPIFGEALGGDEELDLPLSPIMDQKKWAQRFSGRRKAGKPHPSEMNEEELALMRNPYANALISNIRQDSFFRRPLPRFFLQQLQIKIHPETKNPWILPAGIRTAEKTKVIHGGSKYVGMNYSALEFLKVKRWKRLQDQRFVISAVWRRDMADHVLQQLRDRVYEEVAASQRWIMSANRDGGKWEDMQLGCVLVWEASEQPKDEQKQQSTGGEGPVGVVGASEKDVPDGTEKSLPDEIDEVDEPARSLIRVKGKTVPSYKMHLLLGSEAAAQLKKKLKIEDVVRKNVILMSARTMNAQMWLWKLAGYLRQPVTSIFEDIDAAETLEAVDKPELSA